jgi:hypothetical protein
MTTVDYNFPEMLSRLQVLKSRSCLIEWKNTIDSRLYFVGVEEMVERLKVLPRSDIDTVHRDVSSQQRKETTSGGPKSG